MNERDFQTYVLHKLDTIEQKVSNVETEVSSLKTKSTLLGAFLGTLFGGFLTWLVKGWKI